VLSYQDAAAGTCIWGRHLSKIDIQFLALPEVRRGGRSSERGRTGVEPDRGGAEGCEGPEDKQTGGQPVQDVVQDDRSYAPLRACR
jgi:hypothetical protein